MAAEAALTGGLSMMTTSTPSCNRPETFAEKSWFIGRPSLLNWPRQSGTTAVAWISTLARSSTSAITCIAAIAG